MPVIGIDTHKRTLAACAVDEVGSVIEERTFRCDAGSVRRTLGSLICRRSGSRILSTELGLLAGSTDGNIR